MVWKMPKDQREGGRGGEEGQLLKSTSRRQRREGVPVFSSPSLPAPGAKARYKSREDPCPPAPQPRFARV